MATRFLLLSLLVLSGSSQLVTGQATVRCDIEGGWCWAPAPMPGDLACYCPGEAGWIKGTVSG